MTPGGIMSKHSQGKLSSHPRQSGKLGSFVTGLRRTGLETKRDGVLYVPESFNPHRPAPLIVSLHGAGGDAHHALDPFKDLADHTGSIILAPESQASTWDIVVGGFGKDVYWIDEALSDVFALYPIDPERIALLGFSDGASYALSLGLTNGDLFSHIIAFSPGFMSPYETQGSPHIFISHGTQDQTLPIEKCSHQILSQLKDEGLDFEYREFEGPHTIPPEIAKEAFVWFLGSEAKQEAQESMVPVARSGIELT